MSITTDGIFEGIPTQAQEMWDITFAVIDYNNITKTKQLTFATSAVGINSLVKNNIKTYPNPFNDFVEISYTLGAKSSVKLNIFDITGKCVESLINEEQTSGNYKVNWKPNILSGLYLYQLEINGHTKTGKLIFQ